MKTTKQIEVEVWNKLQKLEIAALEVEINVREYILKKLQEHFDGEGLDAKFVAEIGQKTYAVWKVEGDTKSVDEVILSVIQSMVETNTEILTGVYNELGDLIDTKSVWKN
jgi:hypothetical protein